MMEKTLTITMTFSAPLKLYERHEPDPEIFKEQEGKTRLTETFPHK